MSDVLSQSTPKTAAEYKTVIKQMFSEMQRLNLKMRQDQADIERTQAETAVLKAETRALLARMGAPV